MTDWGDPETLWLNITNAALGLICLACVALVATAFVRLVMARASKRALTASNVHSFVTPKLGLTMADGGEPVEEERAEEQRRPPAGTGGGP